MYAIIGKMLTLSLIIALLSASITLLVMFPPTETIERAMRYATKNPVITLGATTTSLATCYYTWEILSAYYPATPGLTKQPPPSKEPVSTTLKPAETHSSPKALDSITPDPVKLLSSSEEPEPETVTRSADTIPTPRSQPNRGNTRGRGRGNFRGGGRGGHSGSNGGGQNGAPNHTPRTIILSHTMPSDNGDDDNDDEKKKGAQHPRSRSGSRPRSRSNSTTRAPPPKEWKWGDITVTSPRTFVLLYYTFDLSYPNADHWYQVEDPWSARIHERTTLGHAMAGRTSLAPVSKSTFILQTGIASASLHTRALADVCGNGYCGQLAFALSVFGISCVPTDFSVIDFLLMVVYAFVDEAITWTYASAKLDNDLSYKPRTEPENLPSQRGLKQKFIDGMFHDFFTLVKATKSHFVLNALGYNPSLLENLIHQAPSEVHTENFFYALSYVFSINTLIVQSSAPATYRRITPNPTKLFPISGTAIIGHVDSIKREHFMAAIPLKGGGPDFSAPLPCDHPPESLFHTTLSQYTRDKTFPSEADVRAYIRKGFSSTDSATTSSLALLSIDPDADLLPFISTKNTKKAPKGPSTS